MRSVGSNAESRSDSKDVVFMVVPLLVMTLLALIGLFLLWRCQLQKTMRRRWPAYPQNRYLASRNSRSLPRILVHRDTPPLSSHAENSHHHHHQHHHPAAVSAPVLPEPPPSGRPTVVISGVERAGGGGAGGRGSAPEAQNPPNGRALYVQDSSVSVASRLSDDYLLAVNKLILDQPGPPPAVRFLYLPRPPADTRGYRSYLQQLELLTRDLGPTLLIHGITPVITTQL